MLLRNLTRSCIKMTQTPHYHILDHNKMEIIKKNMSKKSELTFKMKAKFLWK